MEQGHEAPVALGRLYTEPFQLQAAGTDSGITSRGLRLRENSHRTLAGQADDPG